MGWLRATEKKNNRQATELNQLKQELRRVTEKLASREGELAEALEQQSATSEILRVIANSSTDIQPVLESEKGRGSTFSFTLPVLGSQHLPSS